MSALERREQIIERMKLRKFDTAYNLAAEFGVSRCTIFRDIQGLSLSGYPVYADMGRGGGIRWVGGKRSFPFTEPEVSALHIAIAIIPDEYRPALENLLRERVKVKVPLDKDDIYGILQQGISQRALAAVLGITESHLSRVLSGQKKPSAELVECILIYKQEVLGDE